MNNKYFKPLFIVSLAFLFASATSCDWSSYEEEEVEQKEGINWRSVTHDTYSGVKEGGKIVLGTLAVVGLCKYIFGGD